MKSPQLGRSTVKFVPLPAELGRSAAYNFEGKKPLRDVPYVPTPDHVVAKMLELADVNERDVVYDLGCGDGRIVITAAKERGCRGVGIDIDPRRIEECNTNAINAGVSMRVRFELTSVFRADFSEATVVALYLLPWMNADLRPRLLTDLRPGTRIVAHQFPINLWPADRIVRIEGQDRVVYLWIVPAKVGGRWTCALRTPDGILRHGTIDFEQEFQTIVATAILDGREWPLESAELSGDRIHFSFGGAEYRGNVEGDAMHASSRGRLEFRARRDNRSA